MDRRAEKRWELIREMLQADASGQVRAVSSQRTLFGIKSEVEQAIERIVAEDEAARAAEREGAKEAAQAAEQATPVTEQASTKSNNTAIGHN